jgi:hypothetical protein
MLIPSSTLKTEANFAPKCPLMFNGLHNVISQNIELLNIFFFFCHLLFVACGDAINNQPEATASEINAVRGKITSDK